jgi:hypothetical protein
MRSLEQLDRWISSKVKNWTSQVSGAPQGRELLEIRRDVLEEVRDHIEPAGGGKNVFPYQSVTIWIAAQNTAQQQVFQGAFSSESNGLEADIRELLTEAELPVPIGFAVTVHVVEDAVLATSSHPFDVEFATRRGDTVPARPPAALKVLRGQADPPEYAIASERVNIGRMKEVTGEREGLRRRNDVAFADTETTVSREHACIRYDSATGKYRIYDTGSQRGTIVFREGRRVDVPSGATRGAQLRSGDEIHLGDARIRFELI